MAKSLVLLEDVVGEFITDSNRIQEDAGQNGRPGLLRVGGRLSLSDVLNGNNRIYPKNVWARQFESGSRLKTLIAQNRSLGLLEHPKDGVVSLLSPISHLLVDAKLQEDGEVRGEFVILNTPEGNRLRALIESGYRPLVSSRGYGSVETDSQGRDIVQDDYVCEGWDVVANPSFKQCEVDAIQPTAESLSQQGAKSSVTESTTPIAGSVDKPEPAPVGAALPAPLLTETITMDAIRSKLAGIAASNPKDLSPAQLAEARSQLRGLHNETAKWLAEDASRSYEATQLHKAIEIVEAKMDEAVSQPRAENARLLTERQRSLAVLGCVVETAKVLKTKLTEAVAANTRMAEVNAKLLESLRAWKALAEASKAKAVKLDEKYNFACESLDALAEKWGKDTTDLGRKIVGLEFGESAAKPEIAERLAKSVHPDDVADIREELLKAKQATQLEAKTEPAKTEAKPDAKLEAKTEAKPDAKTEAKPDAKQESVTPPPTPKQEAKSVPSPIGRPLATLTHPRVLKPVAGPSTLKESIAIARRLSGKPLTEAATAAA